MRTPTVTHSLLRLCGLLLSCPSHNELPLPGAHICPLCNGDEVFGRAWLDLCEGGSIIADTVLKSAGPATCTLLVVVPRLCGNIHLN